MPRKLCEIKISSLLRNFYVQYSCNNQDSGYDEIQIWCSVADDTDPTFQFVGSGSDFHFDADPDPAFCADLFTYQIIANLRH